MGTKIVCKHRYSVPRSLSFKNKYYSLVTSLLFEYEANGYYRNDLEIFGFNEIESVVLCESLPCFYQEGITVKTENFDYSTLERMISILPLEKKELLIDHIVLSSIDKASSFQTLSLNLKTNFSKTGESLYLPYFSKLDFDKFFKNKESTFMNEYYPSEDLKDEIRLQYRLKR